MVPTFTERSISQGGTQLYPGSIAAPTPQTFDAASPPTLKDGFGVSHHHKCPSRDRGDGCALHPGPYPPDSSRQRGYGASTTGSLTLYLLTLLGEPAPSGSAGTSRLCRGRLPPSPAFPGSGCPQLLPDRCDGPRETVSHHLSIYPAPRGALDRLSE
jgi:hypothetical protein